MQPSLLEVPNMKSYHTPSVPRKHARLQVLKAPRLQDLKKRVFFPRPSRCPLQTQKSRCRCRSRNRSRQTLDSLTLRTKKEGESDPLWVSAIQKGREAFKFQNVRSRVFRFRSENESLAISPVRNHPGLALYQDLSVLSESTTSRSTI